VPFVFVGGPDTWCALGRPGGREVTVSATGWPHDGLALVAAAPRDVPRDLAAGAVSPTAQA
jgi:hypothetical protein